MPPRPARRLATAAVLAATLPGTASCAVGPERATPVGVVAAAILLGKIATSSADAESTRVAVLPFEIRSPDTTDVYLAEGLAEDVVEAPHLARGEVREAG